MSMKFTGKQIRDAHLLLAGVFLLAVPLAGSGEIIWSGGYETGDFTQWHSATDPNRVVFNQVPEYGRPTQYGYQPPSHVGDGSLLSLVQSPTRGSPFAAKFIVKNSVNGSEPNDCDGSVCDRRRTELTAQQMLSDYYNALPYLSERWVSFSAYIPSDWDFSGSGSVTIFQFKPRNESGLSSTFAIMLAGANNWTIYHRWSPVENPTKEQFPWQQQMRYAGNENGVPYPRTDNWPDGLSDFPNVEASYAALQSVNVGGWTDWIVHLKFDARGSTSGGQGFINLWKREDSGSWVQVLNIKPKQTTRGGMTFDHGIGYKSPASYGNNGGFGIKAGMYMPKEKVWNGARDRVIYNANIKVGDEATRFSQMSHDGSSPESLLEQPEIAPPEPPQIAPAQ